VGEFEGAFAASVTPLRDGGAALDEDAVGPVVDFLASGGVRGMLALGTAGEGILLSVAERKRAAECFLEAAGDRLAVFVHCGAQTTADTAALAAHAAEIGAAAVAVIGPPYFPLDERAIVNHFTEAARAAFPLPFYLYAFAARAGYEVSPGVVRQIRERAPNFAGLKVSETPWERFRPYLIEGLEVFVGPEALIGRGMAAGAVGAVSALAAAFPDVVSAVVANPTEEAAARAGALRAAVQRFPFQSALKAVLGLRGVPIRADVRAPLRTLEPDELRELEQVVDEALAGAPA
jgi:dihydrodipicolinate synthase/N-acetylneuraminate lyase